MRYPLFSETPIFRSMVQSPKACGWLARAMYEADGLRDALVSQALIPVAGKTHLLGSLL